MGFVRWEQWISNRFGEGIAVLNRSYRRLNSDSLCCRIDGVNNDAKLDDFKVCDCPFASTPTDDACVYHAINTKPAIAVQEATDGVVYVRYLFYQIGCVVLLQYCGECEWQMFHDGADCSVACICAAFLNAAIIAVNRSAGIASCLSSCVQLTKRFWTVLTIMGKSEFCCLSCSQRVVSAFIICALRCVMVSLSVISVADFAE